MVASIKASRGEILVNSTTKNIQADPNIAANLATGGFQIVWESEGQDGDGLGVFAQNFNGKGVATGTEISIADMTVGDQENPDVAFDANGNGMWVWQTAAIYNSAASDPEEPSVANTFPAANYRTSSKTFGFVDGDGGPDSDYRNFERLRDGGWDDDPVGKDAIDPMVISVGNDMFINGWYRKDEDRAEFRYSLDQVSADFDKVISANGDYSRGFAEAEKTGRIYTNFGDVGLLRTADTRFGDLNEYLVVTTLASDKDAADGVIQFQIFQESHSAGLAFKYGQNLATDYNERFVLDQSGLTGDASTPHVAILKKGAFAITWEEMNEGADNPNSDVYVQVFNKNLKAAADAIKVHNPSGANQDGSQITTLKDGGFMVTWTDDSGKDGDGSSIMAQRFDASGVKLGKAITVNTTSGGDQTDSALATLKNGKVAVTWESDTGDGSKSGIMAQLFSAKAYGKKKAQELEGTSANEKFSTGAKRDTVDGGGGNDRIDGGGGGDRLNGGEGNDTLIGGGGKDKFIFASGADKILDFQDDADTVVFSHSLVTGKLSLKRLAKIAETDGDDLVFDFGGGDVLTVNGVSSYGDIRDDISFIA